ncbi:Carbonic anhydrase [Neolecta irregularis DAH-3]|uniref:Carbonic anhydrase n=1 Tax=Neolecta irregularis (strain DAH-3) TaxID=1198029 RepID=A0A1U7LVF1_NEOID|nr:Carbonic anhydrase [Neolecta irregularis DAH-3]|eukprot:OLL26598.1 Carbonic anhydrase [Neolecta irregularis DAH-3]
MMPASPSPRTSQTQRSTIAHFYPQDPIQVLLDRNDAWSKRVTEALPYVPFKILDLKLKSTFFSSQEHTQTPFVLWLGCSDARVPETKILDLLPGEVFVHRNIANIIPLGDQSSHSVIQFAVDILGVKHIIVCGHYGCGGIAASLASKRLGSPIDDWLRNVGDVRSAHQKELDSISDPTLKARRLVELNVMAQVRNVLRTSTVVAAREERDLQVHAWVYDVGCGKLKALQIPTNPEEENCC